MLEALSLKEKPPADLNLPGGELLYPLTMSDKTTHEEPRHILNSGATFSQNDNEKGPGHYPEAQPIVDEMTAQKCKESRNWISQKEMRELIAIRVSLPTLPSRLFLLFTMY